MVLLYSVSQWFCYNVTAYLIEISVALYPSIRTRPLVNSSGSVDAVSLAMLYNCTSPKNRNALTD